jgi:hypothetical protein
MFEEGQTAVFGRTAALDAAQVRTSTSTAE